MELFQFRHSAFCEKVHLLLAAKGLSYSVKDVTPGVGQIELFQLTGQRQVPVLRDGEQLIADSSAIAMHLESKHPDPALLPSDAAERAHVLLLEDWADTALASSARMALLQGAAEDPVLRGALLPDATPSLLRNLIGAVPGDLLGGVGQLLPLERDSLIFARAASRLAGAFRIWWASAMAAQRSCCWAIHAAWLEWLISPALNRCSNGAMSSTAPYGWLSLNSSFGHAGGVRLGSPMMEVF